MCHPSNASTEQCFHLLQEIIDIEGFGNEGICLAAFVQGGQVLCGGDSLLPIRQYVFVAGDDEEAVLQQLEAWEKQFPRSAAMPLPMGLKLYNVESPKAKPWLLKAAALQPGNADVWVMLHLDAERRGDNKAAHEYMGKASAAVPENPNYAYYYIRYYEFTDPAVWRTKIYELVKRFPNDERGAQGLYEVAMQVSGTAGKIKALEQLRTSYDPHKFGWSSNCISLLYDTYMKAGQTAKAKELAVAMGTGDGWDLRQSMAGGMEQVNALMKAKKYPEAMKQLAQLKAPPSRLLRVTWLC